MRQLVNRAWHFLRRVLRRQRIESELQEEVQSYFDAMTERRMGRGLTREEAERGLRLESGGAGKIAEQVRDARAGAWIEAAFLDVRYAWRTLRKSPGFAVAAMLSLGLGLGANIAIFTLVDTVMLQSLPVKDPARLVFIDNSGGKSGGSSGPPYPCYELLRDHNHYLSGIAAFNEDRLRVTIDGVEEKMTGQYASGSYFNVLGVRPVLGRLLTPADDSVVGRGGPDGPLVVISYRLWDARFHRSPAVLGKAIRVGTNWVKIAGVTPPGFDGLTPGLPVDVTIPMMLFDSRLLQGKRVWWLSVVGRLKDGAPAEQARAELDTLFHTYMADIGGGTDNRYFSGIVLAPAAKGLGGLRRRFSKPLAIVMAIAGLVLLIGCANAANLLLARSSARRDEIALRLAIGASRGRLVRQLFTEGLFLTGLAAAAGVLLAKWGVAALATLLAGVQGRIVITPSFDWRVLAFAAVTGLLTSVLFSIAPALHAARADAAKPGTETRGGAAGFPIRAGSALVAVQVMLSVVLLCGAALFLRSLRNLTGLDAGFQREGVVIVETEAVLPRTVAQQGKAAEERHGQIGRMWEEALGPLRGLPAARAASVSSMSPLSGRDRGILMTVSGAPAQPGLDRGIHINQTSAGYFDVFGVALLAGRAFTPADGAASSKVAILNDTAARHFFADSNPLGRRVSFPGQRVTAEYEIVGLVHDTRYESLRKAAEPMVYVPIEQAIDPLSRVLIGIRTQADASGLLTVLRDRVPRIVPGGFIGATATLDQIVDESLVQERLLSILANLFGGLALLLAAIGIYGILSFAIVRRTREIGIRMALGARRVSVMWMVLRRTLALAGAGLAPGFLLVLAGKKYIQSELFGLHGLDPGSIGAAVALLAAVAVGAGAWPAWRASRLDPTIALRHE